MTWQHITANWKTSLSGFLSFIIATSAVLTALPPGHLDPRITFWIAVVSGLAKAYVGILQKDAGTQLAYVPGKPSPQPEPSHEQPNNPQAKPVKD